MNPQTQAPRPATIRKYRPLSRRVTGLLMAVLLLVIVFSYFVHRPSQTEKLVAHVLEAVQRNDMAPVAKDFNAVTREKLTRASVGRNADLLAPLGALKNITENTPKDAPARRHTFLAKFDKGSVDVTMVLDEDGKITGFRFLPAASENGK